MTEKAKPARLAEETKELAEEAKNQTWVSGLARLGYAVRGLLYALVGYLAIQMIFTGRGKITDREGVLAAIATRPFGEIVLAVIAAGLVGMTIWMVIVAVTDLYRKGSHTKGMLSRAGQLITGLSYGVLIFPVIRLMRAPGAQVGSSDQPAEQVASGILQMAWGSWLVGAIGLVIMGIGLGRIYKGWKADFDEQFKAYKLSSKQKKWATRAGRFGTAAIGVVMVTIGFLAVLAALTLDPQKVGGFDAALLFLTRQPYGPWLLGLISLGLIAYAAYSFLGALWFRIRDL